jgi:3-deoxy-manno-octulosonate cytidylyltransferase (CMP-KDO synthetase)
MFQIVIPARYGSTRLPGKALLPILDKPMIAWVWERAMQADADRVIVATDDARIAKEMTARGAEVAHDTRGPRLRDRPVGGSGRAIGTGR